MDEWVKEWWTSCPFNLKQCQEISPPTRAKKPINSIVYHNIFPKGATPRGIRWHVQNINTYLFLIQNIFTILIG